MAIMERNEAHEPNNQKSYRDNNQINSNKDTMNADENAQVDLVSSHLIQ